MPSLGKPLYTVQSGAGLKGFVLFTVSGLKWGGGCQCAVCLFLSELVGEACHCRVAQAGWLKTRKVFLTTWSPSPG